MTFCTVQRLDINLLKHNSCLCGEFPLIYGSNRKSLRISSFKGCDRVQGSQYRSNRVKIPCVSWDHKENLLGPPSVHNIGAQPISDTDVTTTGSVAIHKLFKSWLALLPLASPNQVQTLDGAYLDKRVEADHKLLKDGILKTVWGKFLGMDATIKIPAIILVPLFLTVNIKYGAQVAKELSPLWIGGPLVVGLYIKMVQVLYSLYVFSFNQLVKAAVNFDPLKNKDLIQVHLWRHVVYFRNFDYKNGSKRRWEHFKDWLLDKFVDYLEPMWSCRKMVGFLKLAKMM